MVINLENEENKLNKWVMINKFDNGIVKLNLGCGDVVLPDFINIDLYDDKADIRLDIVKLPLPDKSVDYILSSHILDHFNYFEGQEMIKEWSRLLKSGGKVKIECSDLLSICKMMLTATEDIQMKLYSCLFGFPWAPGMAHKFGYTKPHLEKLLKQNGFNDIKDVELIEVADYSTEKIDKYNMKYDDSYEWFDKETFKYLNISVEATKI